MSLNDHLTNLFGDFPHFRQHSNAIWKTSAHRFFPSVSKPEEQTTELSSKLKSVLQIKRLIRVKTLATRDRTKQKDGKTVRGNMWKDVPAGHLLPLIQEKIYIRRSNQWLEKAGLKHCNKPPVITAQEQALKQEQQWMGSTSPGKMWGGRLCTEVYGFIRWSIDSTGSPRGRTRTFLQQWWRMTMLRSCETSGCRHTYGWWCSHRTRGVG